MFWILIVLFLAVLLIVIAAFRQNRVFEVWHKNQRDFEKAYDKYRRQK